MINRRSFFVFTSILIILVIVVIVIRKSNYIYISNQEKFGLEVKQSNLIPAKPIYWIVYGNQDHPITKIGLQLINEIQFNYQEYQINKKFITNNQDGINEDAMANLIVSNIKSGIYQDDIIWLNPLIYKKVANTLNEPLWGKENLVNFEFIPSFKDAHQYHIFSDPYFRNQTGGIYPGPYIEGIFYVFWFNPEVSKKIGININVEGMHFEELLDYLKSVFNYNNKFGTKIAAFYDTEDNMLLSNIFQKLFIANLTNKELIENNFNLDKQEALRKTLEDFERMGNFKPLLYSVSKKNKPYQVILNEEALFICSGSTIPGFLESENNISVNHLIPAELPMKSVSDYYLGTYQSTWAVLKNSENKEMAITFLMDYVSKKAGKKWNKLTKSTSGVRNDINENIHKLDAHQDFFYKLSDKYSNRIRYFYTTDYIFGNQKDFNPLLSEYLQKLLADQITANDAYNEIIQVVSNN